MDARVLIRVSPGVTPALASGGGAGSAGTATELAVSWDSGRLGLQLTNRVSSTSFHAEASHTFLVSLSLSSFSFRCYFE